MELGFDACLEEALALHLPVLQQQRLEGDLVVEVPDRLLVVLHRHLQQRARRAREDVLEQHHREERRRRRPRLQRRHLRARR